MSFDDGQTWQNFQLNLPVCPIYDLLIKNNDLIAATHGRSFWILDDLSPLHQFQPGILSQKAHLFDPQPSYRISPTWDDDDWFGGSPGKNYVASFKSGDVNAYYEHKLPEGGIAYEFWMRAKTRRRGSLSLTACQKQLKARYSLNFMMIKAT